VEPRDFVDTAAALGRYSVSQLIDFAQRLDPGLTRRDFTDAGRMLDQLDDEVFLRYGLSEADVGGLRKAMAAWPR
jgi:hypothetical protein